MEQPDSILQKRKATDQEQDTTPNKRSNPIYKDDIPAQPQSLATWLKVPPPPPLSDSLATSNPIFDKDSIFIAYVLPLSEKEVTFKHIGGLIERLQHKHHKLPDVIAGRSKREIEVQIAGKKGIKPSHNMWAARYLAPKKGAKGIKEDDYEPKELAADDGEKYGSERLLKVLREEGASDILLICSRWFGGTLIGPVRFNHIENCAREAVIEFSRMEKVNGLRSELEELDNLVDDLRAELAGTTSAEKENENSVTRSGGNRTYRLITDTDKLERLIKAKSMTVKLLVEKVAVKSAGPVETTE